ncbi:hypothetical protein Tco_1003429 [Tanacetum coccineum]|uniref:Uncharacterized protein n=1 Tax=Tanacetum coccineum TaxID=301880 RepID=A0ABQ5F931_9ASTR
MGGGPEETGSQDLFGCEAASSRSFIINNFEANSRSRKNPSEAISPWASFFAKRYLRAEWSRMLYAFVQMSLTSIVDRPKLFHMTVAPKAALWRNRFASHISLKGRSQFGAIKLKLPFSSTKNWLISFTDLKLIQEFLEIKFLTWRGSVVHYTRWILDRNVPLRIIKRRINWTIRSSARTKGKESFLREAGNHYHRKGVRVGEEVANQLDQIRVEFPLAII